MEYLEKNRKKDWVRLKPEGLKWTPFLVTRGFGLTAEVGSTAKDGTRKSGGGVGGKADAQGEVRGKEEGEEEARSPSLHAPELENGGGDTFDYGRSVEPEATGEEEEEQVDEHVEIEDEEEDEEEEPLLLSTNSSSSDSDDGDGYSDTSSARRRRRRSSRTRPASTRPQRTSARSTRAASTSTPNGNNPSSPRRALRGQPKLLEEEDEGEELVEKVPIKKIRKSLPPRDSNGHFARSTPKPNTTGGRGGLGLDVISLVTGARRADESMDVERDE